MNSTRFRLNAITVMVAMMAICNLSFAQFTSTNFLPYGRYMRINPGPDQRAVGVGKFTNANLPQSILHVNSNLITPTGGIFAFPQGEVFRTDCPNGEDTYWRMLRGGSLKGSIYNLAANNDLTIQADQPNSVMRLNTAGNQRMWISQNNVNEPRVGIGTTLAFPATYLQLGQDVLGNSGWRNWMNVGTLSYWDSDNMYVGLRRIAPDEHNAIINWGNNPANTAIGDRLLFLFTGAANNGQASTADGLETARMVVDLVAPNVVNSFTGIGGDPTTNQYTANPDPGNTLEINSFGLTTAIGGSSGLRFTNLNTTSPTTVTNPGLGVLAVDGNGDVIYVPDAPGTGGAPADNGLTLTTGLHQFYEWGGTLHKNTIIDLAGFFTRFRSGTGQNLLFLPDNGLAQVNTYNPVGSGVGWNFDVLANAPGWNEGTAFETTAASIMVASQAGSGIKGIKGIATGDVNGWHIGVQGVVSNTIGWNVGFHTNINANNATGFFPYTANQGLRSTVSGSDQNFGIYTKASGASAVVNYGIFTESAMGAVNYGVKAVATGGMASFGVHAHATGSAGTVGRRTVLPAVMVHFANSG